MLDHFRRVHSNGHAKVVDEPMSEDAIERGLRRVRIHAVVVFIREIALIAAAAAVVWTLFRAVGALDKIVEIQSIVRGK